MRQGSQDETETVRIVTSYLNRARRGAPRAVVLTACVMALSAGALPIKATAAGSEPGSRGRWSQTTDDQRRIWNFDAGKTGESPVGFTAVTVGEGPSGRWIIDADPQSPSPPNRLIQDIPCTSQTCLHVLFFDGAQYDYPDVTVRLRAVGEGAAAMGGIVFAAKDERNFYAVLVDLTMETLEVVRVVNGEINVMGKVVAKRKPTSWHSLRAQHNTNLSKDYIEVSFDGQVQFSTWDTDLTAGRIGLVTRGGGPVAFDNLFAIQLFSQRPLSPPAPY